MRETPLQVSPEFLAEMREFYQPDYAIYDRLDEINAVGMEKLSAMVNR
jgi:hypothetical protein